MLLSETKGTLSGQDLITVIVVGTCLAVLESSSMNVTERKIDNCVQAVLKASFNPIEAAVKGGIFGGLLTVISLSEVVITTAIAQVALTTAVVSALASVVIASGTIGLCLANPSLVRDLVLL